VYTLCSEAHESERQNFHDMVEHLWGYSGASGALSAQMSEESSMTPISSGS
jgi:hypothetical protein